MQTTMSLSKNMRMDPRPKSTTRIFNFKIIASVNKMKHTSDNSLENNSKERKGRENYANKGNKINWLAKEEINNQNNMPKIINLMLMHQIGKKIIEEKTFMIHLMISWSQTLLQLRRMNSSDRHLSNSLKDNLTKSNSKKTFIFRLSLQLLWNKIPALLSEGSKF